MDLYLSQYLGVDPSVLADYGAFDVSVASDLPLFIDPFLLFNSEKEEYQELHEAMLTYLRFLRAKSVAGELTDDLVKSWFMFPEVKQNWFGFTVLGNGGRGLGKDFADALRDSLATILNDFGSESITRSSHLEKVSLVRSRVGRDGISDFTTNLIKDFLLRYTETFAREHLDPEQCRTFAIRHARFNYDTETWDARSYDLPVLWGDFVVLTPVDMLTRDDTWISHNDMLGRYSQIAEALPDGELRGQVNNYFAKALGTKKANKETYDKAAASTIREYPQLLDWYIKLREDAGDEAESQSLDKVKEMLSIFVKQLKAVVDDLKARTNFYEQGWSSYDETLARAKFFKHYVEDQDGWKLINRAGKPFAQEKEVQLYFGLVWFATKFDINREPNNGRGPVDYKVSIGAGDKSLIEFKLASNTQLKQNLEKQLAVYEAANQTATSVSVIICYTAADQAKVTKVLGKLGMIGREDIVVIDGRSDDKPTGSKA